MSTPLALIDESAPLARYENAKRALAEARTVDDVKQIRDKSEAMRLYAQQAKDTELETYAAEIKLRAQRRLGELSRELEKAEAHGGKVCLPIGGKPKSEVLKAAGVSTSTAHLCEQIAAIAEKVIEDYIADKRKRG